MTYTLCAHTHTQIVPTSYCIYEYSTIYTIYEYIVYTSVGYGRMCDLKTRDYHPRALNTTDSFRAHYTYSLFSCNGLIIIIIIVIIIFIVFYRVHFIGVGIHSVQTLYRVLNRPLPRLLLFWDVYDQPFTSFHFRSSGRGCLYRR